MATAEQLDEPEPIEQRPLRTVDHSDVAAGPGEVLIEVGACAVCRTDLQIVEGDLPARRLPIIPGHQVVGCIREVGEGVADRFIGQRVGVGWLAGTCGVCGFCRTERENLCEQATFTGWDRPGGYSDLITARADFTYLLPETKSDEDLAPLLCGGVIGYRALRLAGIQAGGRLGLFGFGASALLVIQVATYWDCEVYVATRSETEQQRALDLGAVWAGSYEDDIPAPLEAAITFAPVGDVVIAALRSLDRGGTVAINAIHLDRVPEFPYELLWWERQLRSVSNFTRRDAEEFLALADEIPIRTVIDGYPLADANEALAELKHGRVNGAAVLSP
ncbi:MAG: zinc-dependent alcohol dehydrogenase family protein [Acidimicrobiia bacterium]